MGAHVLRVEVSSRGCAAQAQISLLVHVETMWSLGESVDRAGDDNRSIRRGLNDLQDTRDIS